MKNGRGSYTGVTKLTSFNIIDVVKFYFLKKKTLLIRKFLHRNTLCYACMLLTEGTYVCVKTYKKEISSNFYLASIATVATEAEHWRGNGIKIDVILIFLLSRRKRLTIFHTKHSCFRLSSVMFAYSWSMPSVQKPLIFTG